MDNILIKKIKNKECKICVIGLGYVGLPLLKLIVEKDFEGIGLDIEEDKVNYAKREKVSATRDAKKALEGTDFIIICVPTPIDENHRPDLKYVEDASHIIAKHMKKNSMIILESTVAPGTTREIILPILKKSKIKENELYLAHCPERVDPGNKKWTVGNIPRVIGGINKESTEIAYAFYNTILDHSDIIKMSNVETAEAVKIVENTFRDINIAFVNELAKSFDKIGIDVKEVIDGASTKPFGFMPHYPGCGVGGHCIAIDPYYLIEKAEKLGFSHKFLKLAREINNSMPDYTVNKIMIGLNKIGKSIKDSKIAILGVAYKGGVSDTRESPAFPVIEKLKKLNAKITIFDPYNSYMSTSKTLDETLKDQDCIVIITNHLEFKKLKPEELKKKNIKVVVDGRNILDKEKIMDLGIIYEGIGR